MFERMRGYMAFWGVVAVLTGCSTLPADNELEGKVHFQAHRGGLGEVPENTMAAFRHAWACPGAVPEVDVQTTRDGVLVCMHDDTPARTAEGPESILARPVSELTFEELRRCDAGVKFAPEYTGEQVPALAEVLAEMVRAPGRMMYLDLKGVDLAQLGALIDEYGVREGVIFTHGDPAYCLELTKRFPGAQTMTWLSGTPEAIKERFDTLVNETQLAGISQIQFHLRVRRKRPEIEYMLDDGYLRSAVERARACGAELQLRPFAFDAPSLARLRGLGVRWFVADEPKRFSQALSGE